MKNYNKWKYSIITLFIVLFFDSLKMTKLQYYTSVLLCLRVVMEFNI